MSQEKCLKYGKSYLMGASCRVREPFDDVFTLMVFSATQPVLGMASTALREEDLKVCVARIPESLLQIKYTVSRPNFHSGDHRHIMVNRIKVNK